MLLNVCIHKLCSLVGTVTYPGYIGRKIQIFRMDKFDM